MSTKGIYLFLSLVSVPKKWISFSTVLIYILAQNLFFFILRVAVATKWKVTCSLYCF